jgi:hypothetical protein
MAHIDLDSTLVIIASGLSQIPDVRHEHEGGMNYYRLNDHKIFARLVGLTDQTIFPLMSRDWQIKVDSKDSAKFVCHTLSGLKVSNEPLFAISQDIEGFVFVETQITKHIEPDAVITDTDQRSIGRFHDLFTNIAVKSAHHTGVGTMWVNKPEVLGGNTKTLPLTQMYHIGLDTLVSSDMRA